MPFGPYEDFADCVAKNQEKDNPEAFCAYLEKQLHGKWPSTMSGALPAKAWPVYLEEYEKSMNAGAKEPEASRAGYKALDSAGWIKGYGGWLHSFAASALKTISGIEIFSSGEWTDSSGDTQKWTDADLDDLVAAFDTKKYPIAIKCGHTSDEFNRRVAESLGIMPDLVTGDFGKGQMALGSVVALKHVGKNLIAAFGKVPEEIANLVENHSYNSVSVEIDYIDGKPFLSAVALLGAEAPALPTRESTEAALVFSKGDNRYTLRPEIKGARELMNKIVNIGKEIASTFNLTGGDKKENIKTQASQNNIKKEIKNMTEAIDIKTLSVAEFCEQFNCKPDELSALFTSLELAEGATFEAMFGKVSEILLKAKEHSEGKTEEHSEQKAELPEAVAAEFSNMKSTIKTLTAANEKHERNERVSKYMKETATFTAIEGTPEELAGKIADVEEKMDEETAQGLLASFREADKARKEAGILIAKGTPRIGDGGENAHPFEKAAQALAEKESITFQQALARLTVQKPKEFKAYHEAVIAANKN